MSAPENAPSADPADLQSGPGEASSAATDAAPVSAPDAVPLSAPLSATDAGPSYHAGSAPGSTAASARTVPRALGVALATVGLLAVTATSTAVTVAVGKPDGRPAAVAAAAPTVSASASAAPSASPSPTPTATPTPTPPPPPAPKPSSTLHGTVDGSTHGGDLRYFFAPIPDNGESFGSADGVKMSDDELSAEYGGQKDIMSILNSYGYKEAAERTYRTADGKANVRIRLMRFSSASHASDFVKNATYSEGDAFDVDGVSGARGFMFKPEQKAYTGEMIGIASKGDVEFEIEIQVKGDPDKAVLADVMRRQRDRLSSGG
ncbi:hypothetical protein [Kitasatospora sp. NBC_00315]|uniref:hypothetical protein n=1 Tax=Kitasatospora sp. NBC_00315 TaxID=2975963 RepID=UPI003247052F